MEKYEIIKTIAEGAFGIVYQGKHKETGEIVAIKEFKKKFFSFEECKSLREVKSLTKLKHENLIKIIQMSYKEDKTLYLVFDYMEKDLYKLMQDRGSKKFSEAQIKYIMFNVLKGVHFMHKYGFFHRDLKPENILIDGDKIKIADLGLAREIRSVPPYTDYVSTRWYRAPECLLKSTNYNSPVDIWALGCIMIELFNMKPIFPGSSEKEVLFKICSTIGTPNNSVSPETIALGKKIDFKFPISTSSTAPTLNMFVNNASQEALDFLNEMLQWDQGRRATASSLLTHAFFTKTSIPLGLATPDKDKFQSGQGKVFSSNINRKKRKEDEDNKQSEDLNEFLENTQDFNDCKL